MRVEADAVNVEERNMALLRIGGDESEDVRGDGSRD